MNKRSIEALPYGEPPSNIDNVSEANDRVLPEEVDSLILGANLGGLSRLESFQIGVGMISRGEVGLIVATVGIDQGIISPGIFAAIVGVVIVTTLVTPPLLRISFRPPKTQPATPIQSGENS